jgi:hypothetical protein
MGLSLIGKLVAQLASPIERLIDNTTTSQEEKMLAQAKLDRIKAEIIAREADTFDKLVAHQADIIVAEAKGGFLQRTWRPVLMYVIILIIANNFLIAPYLSPHFPNHVMVLDLPDKLYTLLIIGVGGYIGGRTWEKKTQADKANKIKEDK